MMDVRSEPVPSQGGRLEGISPLSSHHDLASLLVRETVQNTWDARDPLRAVAPVRYVAEGCTFSGTRMELLRDLLPLRELGGFPETSQDAAEDGDEVGRFRSPEIVLSGSDSVDVLVLSDRNTVGLCGPTRSGTSWDPFRLGRAWPGAAKRFANFVRNTGRARRNTGRGEGGSYGIGKAVIWRASSCSTVLIHTRTTDKQGNAVDRVIGTAFGQTFDRDNRQYTGRHFTGMVASDDDDLVEPVEGEQAQRIAAELGLPAYEEDQFGTSIVIVAPRLLEHGEAGMLRIRDALRWHAWPHLAAGVRPDHDSPDIISTVTWDGLDLSPGPVEDDIELQPYVDALRDALTGTARPDHDPPLDFEAVCGRPRQHLGWTRLRPALSTENAFHATAEPPREEHEERNGDDLPGPAAPMATPYGGVALIRREPLLLVKYERLSVPETSNRHYGGVFLSADEPIIEEALTAAEPPAHDDWIFEQVDPAHSRDYRPRFVKRTIEEVRQHLRTFGREMAPPATAGAGAVQLSSRLSRGFQQPGGRGGRRREQPRPGGGGRRDPSALTVQLAPLEHRSTADGAEHRLEVTVTPPAEQMRLIARAVARDSEGAMDIGEDIAFWWETSAGTTEGSELIVGQSDQVVLTIRVARDARVRPSVRAEVLGNA